MDELEREGWVGRIDFLLSCAGNAVGLGAIWRFPYLCYKHGGASFVLAYVLMLVMAGIPVTFFEVALGQFASEGVITVWKVSPIFTGIGFAMIITSAFIAVYYNVIIMYSIYYMLVSLVNLDGTLPWETCDNHFNTDRCRREPFTQLVDGNETFNMDILYKEKFNATCVSSLLPNMTSFYNLTHVTISTLNSTQLQQYHTFRQCKLTWTSSSQEYWSRQVTRYPESDGIGVLGGVSLKNVSCLFLAWILIFLCILKGVRSFGKVVYFTATVPLIILIVLLVRGVTLPGHLEGIKFYIIPVWNRLLSATLWGDAAGQIFFSLGPGFGGVLNMASYNNFKHNCYRDTVIVAIVNCLSGIVAGFAIFSLLGFMAHEANVEVREVVDQGWGLAFIAYPEGISRLPVAPLWGFLFFFMLTMLGMTCECIQIQTVIGGITDLFPHQLRGHRVAFTALCCCTGFLLGIPITTYGGVYVLTLMNSYGGSYNLVYICLCELCCIMYVYGIRRFMSDIEMMLGFKPNPYWLVTWSCLTPLVILFIIIISIIQNAPADYNGYVFEDWAQGVGWTTVILPAVVIILTAAGQAYRLGLRKSLQPAATWGPADPVHRTGRYTNDVTSSSVKNDITHPCNDVNPFSSTHLGKTDSIMSCENGGSKANTKDARIQITSM